MSNDVLQPCRHFNKLTGLEDTSSTDTEAFRASQRHLLQFRETNTALARGRAFSPHRGLHCALFGLGSHQVNRIQIQQLRKENQQCTEKPGAALFRDEFPPALWLFMTLFKGLFQLYLNT